MKNKNGEGSAATLIGGRGNGWAMVVTTRLLPKQGRISIIIPPNTGNPIAYAVPGRAVKSTALITNPIVMKRLV